MPEFRSKFFKNPNSANDELRHGASSHSSSEDSSSDEQDEKDLEQTTLQLIKMNEPDIRDLLELANSVIKSAQNTINVYRKCKVEMAKIVCQTNLISEISEKDFKILIELTKDVENIQKLDVDNEKMRTNLAILIDDIIQENPQFAEILLDEDKENLQAFIPADLKSTFNFS